MFFTWNKCGMQQGNLFSKFQFCLVYDWKSHIIKISAQKRYSIKSIDGLTKGDKTHMWNHAPRRRNGWNMSWSFSMLRRAVSDFLTSHDTRFRWLRKTWGFHWQLYCLLTSQLKTVIKIIAFGRFIFNSGINSKNTPFLMVWTYQFIL